MPTIRDDALVIGLTPTGESDLVVRLLCRERGRRTALARSARSSRKRFAGALQPFNHIHVVTTLRRTKPLESLDSAEVVEGFRPLRDELSKIYMASYYCDLLNALLADGEDYPGFFETTLFFLHRLTQTKTTLAHRLFFEIRILDALGYRPEACHCAESGCVLVQGGYFDPERQAFLCPEAGRLAKGAFSVSHKARNLLENVAGFPLAQLDECRLSSASALELLAVNRAVLLSILGRPLQSALLLDEELGLCAT